MRDDNWISLQHGRVFYRLLGQRQSNSRLMVFVHGIGGYHFQFEPLAHHLIQCFNNSDNGNGDECASCDMKLEGDPVQILLFDLYGRGYSDMPASHVAHNEELFLVQMWQLLTKLGLIRSSTDTCGAVSSEPGRDSALSQQPYGSFVLLGHSMGGALAMHFAAKYPQLVSHLILLSPAGLPWELPAGAGLLEWLPNSVAALAFKAFQKVAPRKEHIEFFDPGRNREVVEWFMERRYTREHITKYYPAFINTVKHFDLMSSPASIVAQQQRPTLVLFAQYDLTISPSEVFSQLVELFSAHNKSAQFGAIRDTRHSFFNERHSTCANIISRFLSRSHDASTDNVGWMSECVDHSEFAAEQQDPSLLRARDHKSREFWADARWCKYLV